MPPPDQSASTSPAAPNPRGFSRLPSGWVELYPLQFLPGYCVLRSEPPAPSIHTLDPPKQAQFLADMLLVGEALLAVTGCYRVNYAILGNTDPVLHAHIVPRYLSEPEDLRKGPPWSYPDALIDARKFDLERDQELIQRIGAAVKTLLAKRAT
jgi:diadenosine tetraphosphate (Ap4A) HIT family hydrolase